MMNNQSAGRISLFSVFFSLHIFLQPSDKTVKKCGRITFFVFECDEGVVKISEIDIEHSGK